VRKMTMSITVLCVVSLTAGAWAQVPASKPMPKAEPVLNHIPAGSLGYVIIPNIDKTIANVEKFLVNIGVGQMLGLGMMPPAEEGAPPQPSMLTMLLKQNAKLGDGFNSNAGFAAVMLDPQAFGINLAKIIERDTAAQTQPGAEAAELKKNLPFVLFVPGTSIQGVFGNYKIVPDPDGKFSRVSLRMSEMFATTSGSYVLLSPNKAALQAVVQSQTKASSELGKAATDLLARSDLAYQINMKTAGPLLKKVFKVIEEKMGGELMGQGIARPSPADIASHKTQTGIMKMYLSLYAQMLEQIDDVTVGVRLAQTGIVLEYLVAVKPGTNMAKTMATLPANKQGAQILNGLPSMPYVLAAGATFGDAYAQNKAYVLDMLEEMLKTEALAKLSEEVKARNRKLTSDYADQITGYQIVLGGAPDGSGVFGLAAVVKCKDSEKVKALMAEECALAETFIVALVEDEEVKKLRLPYSRNVEQLGSISLDAIEILHPKLLELDEMKREKMKQVLGEDKVRILVAAADKNTVVVTFGGGMTFMGEALNAAPGKGPIPNDAGTKEIMKYMPKDAMILCVFNVANLMDVIRTGMVAVGGDPQASAMIPQLTCKTPIACGVNVRGNAMHAVLYIPNELIKEGMQKVMMMLMAGGMMGPGAGGRPMPPAPMDNDF